jgi:hypothetical protein
VQRNRLPPRCLKGDQKLVIREDGTVPSEVPNLNHEFALGNIHVLQAELDGSRLAGGRTEAFADF